MDLSREVDLSNNGQFLSPNSFQTQDKVIGRARSATIQLKKSLQDLEESKQFIGNCFLHL